MKKALALILAFFFLLGTSCATATNTNEPEEKTYEDQVAQIMQTYSENPKTAKEALKKLDTKLISEPESLKPIDQKNSGQSVPTDYRIILYAFQKDGSDICYLQWSIIAERKEWSPGSFDWVTLHWDADYADYYAASAEKTATSLKGREENGFCFNVEDGKLKTGKACRGTVLVTPVKSGRMVITLQFTHTYQKLFGINSSTVQWNRTVDHAVWIP